MPWAQECDLDLLLGNGICPDIFVIWYAFVVSEARIAINQSSLSWG
jgi:hypothetical protein